MFQFLDQNNSKVGLNMIAHFKLKPHYPCSVRVAAAPGDKKRWIFKNTNHFDDLHTQTILKLYSKTKEIFHGAVDNLLLAFDSNFQV